MPSKKLTPKDAYKLFHAGAIALADVEANGFRMDVDKLDETIEEVGEQIGTLTKELKEDEIWDKWEETFKAKANLDSRTQLGKVLFEKLNYEPTGTTEKGRNKVDEESLEALDLPFVKKYLALQKLKKLRSTYLKGIRREIVDGFLHAFYNLHLAISFRSSSDSPNFQNIPIRLPDIGKLIRECFIARDDHVILEIDYSALEFKISCAWWRDKEMLKYAFDPTRDIHRDMAAECYMLPEDAVPKTCRFYTKNQFVFPELYGSYYVQCAKNLWFAIESAKLTTADDIPLKKHLRSKGIKKLGRCNSREDPVPGTYEHHIWEVEESFNNRFSQYAARKEKWWKRYQERGRFRLMTGFDVQGVYSRNQVYNIPIQGPAFHCLLWSLIKLNDWLKRKKMKSMIVGTIHDSILFDCHKDELQDVMVEANKVMTEDIRKEWDWICVPLEVEFEASPVNGSWWEKKEIEL